MMTSLPINDFLANLKKTLRSHVNAVLTAPPGAGKTTRIPLALMGEYWLNSKKIIMLEPRRLAARSAARYMAALLGEQVGETVGYRIRLDRCIGPKTIIEVVTEGVLTRMLQADPALEGVGLVIFDEFHERNLQADLGLALCLESQSVLRSDLRLLIMSATLDAQPVATLLGHAPVIVSNGREFPVETIYLKQSSHERLEAVVTGVIRKALHAESGDLLVFLPGAGEIRRVAKRLEEARLEDIRIAPLHGSLPQREQDLAIAPSRPGERKVVLATSIAETSLTVEGVRVVIDSGLMRVPRFSARTGMSRLETVFVSRASADQRRGRAGRLGPGICYRLWTREFDLHLVESRQPEILEADLAPLVLELAVWGGQDPYELAWLDPPPRSALSQAKQLLTELGAFTTAGKITAHGRQMAACSIHPRLAHMILQGISLQLGPLACELAALLGERDLLRGEVQDADIRLRLEGLRYARGCDLSIQRKIRAELAHLQRLFTIKVEHQDSDACGLLLTLAYPDRVAQQRNNGKFLLKNGRGAMLPNLQPLSQAGWLAAVQIDDKGDDSRILLAAPLQVEDLASQFADQLEIQEVIAWDRSSQSVRSKRYQKFGALTIKEESLLKPNPGKVLTALLEGIKQEGLAILPWTRTARRLQQRLLFMHCHQEDWPEMTDEALLATLDDWLAPYLYGVISRTHLEKINLIEILESRLSWEQRQQLDTWAPTHVVVPSGQKIPVDYSVPDTPVLAVRLQELFGLKETPRIARGRVALTMHLLSPAHRPVQVTKDLASFWQNAYFEVKKDLAGRYPKHEWPDDPLIAVPTRVKKRT